MNPRTRDRLEQHAFLRLTLAVIWVMGARSIYARLT